jgi:hypothetical protein
VKEGCANARSESVRVRAGGAARETPSSARVQNAKKRKLVLTPARLRKNKLRVHPIDPRLEFPSRSPNAIATPHTAHRLVHASTHQSETPQEASED